LGSIATAPFDRGEAFNVVRIHCAAPAERSLGEVEAIPAKKASAQANEKEPPYGGSFYCFIFSA